MPMRLGYLYSRYPVISQTFCDAEMLALERRGLDLEIGSINPPLTSFRHADTTNFRAAVRYAPPSKVVETMAQLARRDGTWPGALVAEHEARYGPAFKPERRARNALFFADHFARSGVAHFHVHFASHATHTALFIKAISKIGFSFTAHAQDFMLDVGSDDNLGIWMARGDTAPRIFYFGKRAVSQENHPERTASHRQRRRSRARRLVG